MPMPYASSRASRMRAWYCGSSRARCCAIAGVSSVTPKTSGWVVATRRPTAAKSVFPTSMFATTSRSDPRMCSFDAVAVGVSGIPSTATLTSASAAATRASRGRRSASAARAAPTSRARYCRRNTSASSNTQETRSSSPRSVARPTSRTSPVTTARKRRIARTLAERVELIVAQLEVERGEVLLQVVEREGARDREHRRRARQEPRERHLRGRRAVAGGDLLDGRRVGAAQGKERHEGDPLLGAVVDDLLTLALDEAVVVLDRHDRYDLSPSL